MLSSRPFAIHDEYGTTKTSKTPGRALKGRAGLQENVLLNGAMTTYPGEKRANSKTPLRKENESKCHITEDLRWDTNKLQGIILKDAPASTKATTVLPSRPLIDKTPAPNRQNSHILFTPLPNHGKISKSLLPALIDEAETTTPVQPPSSSRKKLRVPRSSSSNKAFETPVTTGDHWNVSDISIEVGESTLDNVEENAIDEPDYSDPEYMPPKVKGENTTLSLSLGLQIDNWSELPFEMPFELPDYTEVGKSLSASARSYPVGGSPTFQEPDTDEILKGCGWPLQVQLVYNTAELSGELVSPSFLWLLTNISR